MKIELIKTEWVSREAQECSEYLHREIARAMFIPAHLLRPETLADVQWRVYLQTSVMRRELERLYIKHTRVVALGKR